MVEELVQLFVSIIYTELLEAVLLRSEIFESKNIEYAQETPCVRSGCPVFRTCASIYEIYHPSEATTVEGFGDGVAILLRLEMKKLRLTRVYLIKTRVGGR